MNDPDPYQQFHELRRIHQWTGTVMTRDDVEDTAGRPLTDDEWNAVTGNWFWRTGIIDRMIEVANDMISEMLHDLDIVTGWDLEDDPARLEREIAFARAALDHNNPATQQWLDLLLDIERNKENP